MATVKLLKDKETHKSPIEILISQVTPQAVCTLFSIDFDAIWLKEQRGQRAFFPNLSKTGFDISEDVEVLIAMGAPAVKPPTLSGFGGSSIGPSVSSFSQPGSSTHSIPAVLQQPSIMSYPARPVFNKKAAVGGVSINVKVVQANVAKGPTGKVEFKGKEQLYIPVKDSEANVPFITRAVQQEWGYDYILVTADGLKLQDSPGTQGLAFWRVGSRKIYAVVEDELNDIGKGKYKGKEKRKSYGVGASHYADLSLRDEPEYYDTWSPPVKKPKVDNADVLSEIKSLKDEVIDMMKIAKGTTIPPRLYKILTESFKCHICHSAPLKLPPIFARCCRNVLGCATCVDEWFKRESTCPLCRNDRALPDTSTINGLDEFIEAISNLIPTDGECDNSIVNVQSHSVPSPPLAATHNDVYEIDSDDLQ